MARASRLCALAVMSVGALAWLGWLAGWETLIHLRATWPGMAPPTATAFLLVGVALVLPSSPRAARAIDVLGGAVLILALGWLGRRLLLGDAAASYAATAVVRARVATITAVSFCMLGGALLALRRSAAWTQALALVAATCGSLGAIRYLYHSPFEPIAPMALHTALGVLVAASALLLRRADASVPTLLIDRGAVGIMLRRLLPMALLLPLVSGWILLNISIDVRTHVLMLAPLNALVFASLIWSASKKVQQSELRHLRDERRFRQVFEGSASGTLVVRRDGTIDLANEATARIFGYSVAELTGMSIEQLVPPEHRAAHVGHRAALAPSRSTRWMLEGRDLFALHRDGKKLPVEVALTPLEMDEGTWTIASVNDLTARRLAEAGRAEEQERFMVLTRATLDTVIDWDMQADTLWVSGGIERAFGWKLTEPATRAWMRERIHPDDLPRMAGEMETLLGNGGELWMTEHRFRHFDGRYRNVLVRALILRAGGKPVRMISTMIDISDRIVTEQALRDRSEALERSNGELERFAQIASHDLQEPLRTIASFVQLLAKRYGDKFDDNGTRYMRYVVDGAERMRALINALLAYSRVDRADAPVTSDVSLAKVFARVRSDLRTAITEKNAELTHDELPVVLGNEIQLAQLLGNIIGNALKYQAPDTRPRIHVTAARQLGRWRISVIDNGIGIDPQYFEKIFAVFQRLHTRETYDGTGIGLAICKRIVERHGGEIWVESRPGEGSAFHFTLRPAESTLEGEAHGELSA